MIVDSVFWIAVKFTKDKYHSIAVDLIPQVLKNDELYVTDYIINEVYAFLLRKANHTVALETLQMFMASSKIKILFNSEATFKETIPILNKYKQLSIVDANIIYFSKKLKQPILTFEEYMNSIKNSL